MNFSALKSTAIALPWISVPHFNLLKYILMTYLLGLLWDIAHVRAIEMKRYMLLWYTGHFSVPVWGSSRNQLFSGNNFETISSALRRKFQFSKDRTEEDEDARPQEAEYSVCNYRSLLFELLTIGLVLLVVCAEATSEIFTDSISMVTFSFSNRNSLVRRNTSEVLQDPDRNYSVVADLLFIRRCLTYRGNETTVTRPNFIVESGEFYQSHNIVPTFNLSLLCIYDENDKDSRAEVHHSPIQLQKAVADLIGTETFTDDNLQHRSYEMRFISKIPVPHFSTAVPSTNDKNFDSELSLFELDNVNFTCTFRNMWCVREVGDQYEVIYSACLGRCTGYSESSVPSDNSTSFFGVNPINISRSSLPLLARDQHMMRPPRPGRSLRDLEENIDLLVLGYTFGWTSQEISNLTVISERHVRIIPTIQYGYIISVSAIVMSSFLVYIIHALSSRKWKIVNLVGEHAFIDRWHGHIKRDKRNNRSHGRTTMAVFGSHSGAAHLQPAVDLPAIPLSKVDVIW